jgi:hypothetical protein
VVVLRFGLGGGNGDVGTDGRGWHWEFFRGCGEPPFAGGTRSSLVVLSRWN